MTKASPTMLPIDIEQCGHPCTDYFEIGSCRCTGYEDVWDGDDEVICAEDDDLDDDTDDDGDDATLLVVVDWHDDSDDWDTLPDV